MAAEILGKINKELSEENSKLQNRNDKLEIENEELRILLAEFGDGKVIPLTKTDPVRQIAALRHRIKSLEDRLSKYESVTATEKYGSIKNHHLTDLINRINKRKEEVLNSKSEPELEFELNREDEVTAEPKEETNSYRPQDATQKIDRPLEPKRRMKAEEVLDIICDFVDGKKPMHRAQIMDGTGLSESQVSKTINKYPDLFNGEKDPKNRRRILYKYVGPAS